MTPEQAKEYLPSASHITGSINPRRLKYLVMAPPKWGKTTFFAGPKTLLLAFEEGHMFIDCPKVVITGWNALVKDRGVGEDEDGIKYTTAIEIIEALEVENPYEFIIMDTTDMASKMCTDYECARARIAHPSDGGDFGKGFDLYQTTPFRRFYNRIVKLGTGVGCLTHVKEEWKKSKGGVEEFRRETSLPGGIQKFIHGQSDVIINGMFGKRRRGMRDRDRVVSFDGTNEVMAGTRINRIYIPNKYVVDPPTLEAPNAPWVQWEGFFSNSPEAGKNAEQQYTTLTRVKNVDEEEEVPPAERPEVVEEVVSELDPFPKIKETRNSKNRARK